MVGANYVTSMMAACTLGFWNDIATSGFDIILEITSSGVRPNWSAKVQITKDYL